MTTTTDLNVHACEFAPSPCRLTLAQHLELAASLQKKAVLDWATSTAVGGRPLAQALHNVAELEKTAAAVADWETASAASESAASAASTTGFSCFFCGKPGHKIAKCPSLKCRYCHKQGHQQKDCKAFADDREWVKWARKQLKSGRKLSGGQLQFLKEWNAGKKGS